MSAPRMSWFEFSERYCRTQEQTPSGLAGVLCSVSSRFEPDGFFLAECEVMDSSYFGSVVILPFGGRATFREVPSGVFSPRGLASDMSRAIGWMSWRDVPGVFEYRREDADNATR